MYFDYKKDIDYVKILRNLSDDDLASFINVSRLTLIRWINGSKIPTYENLETMYCNFFDNNFDFNQLKEEIYRSKVQNNHQILFHGAKTEIVGSPSIEYSDNNKDFGKGFYLGESLKQSASFVSNYPFSSIYIFDFDKSNVNIKEYTVSEEWMILIAYFRGKLNQYKYSQYLKKILDNLKNVDVVIAPIADNTMYIILNDFIDGKITDLQTINALSANRLGKQYVFLNDEIITNNLKMLERCFYCKKERDQYKKIKEKENEVGKNKVKIALREYAGKGKYIEELLNEKA